MIGSVVCLHLSIMEPFKPLSEIEVLKLIDDLRRNYRYCDARILCFAMTMVEFQRRGMFGEVYAPHGDCSDITILICFKMKDYCMICYHSETETGCERLKRAFEKTRLFSDTGYLFIAGANEAVHSAVGVDWIRMELVEHVPCYIFTKPIEDALTLDLNIPNDIEVRNLRKEDAELVDSLWPLSMEGTLEYIGKMIELCPSVGLYRKSDGRLLSWTIKSQFGAIGFLQTVDEAKRKGYARIAVTALSKILARQNFPIHAAVRADNTSSSNLFHQLGFTNQFNCHYLKYKKFSQSH